MKYLFSDFYLLAGAADKETRTVGDAYRRMAGMMGIPVDPACLLFALRGLCAGGLVTVSPAKGVIAADTLISVTEAGRKAVAISGFQKLLGNEFKAFNKNEAKFCTTDRPAVTSGEDWIVESEGFAEIANGLMRDHDIAAPLFELTEAGDELLTLTVRHPNHSSPASEEDGEEAYDPDAADCTHSVSVTGSAERVMQAMSDLLAAAQGLLTKPTTRKVALHGADRSYIVTLARTASDEYGTALRMTVEQIRFNRQRFYGKRDGELDYAQCGDPIILHEMNGAAGFAALLLPCAVALPERLGEAELEAITAIHHELK